MIKVRGWQVSPAELESVLLIHTEVLEAAVIGSVLPNSNAEAPRAYIVRSPESNLNEVEIKTHMAEYLAKYKNLDGGIVFTNKIPRTSTGKIDRKQLRERAKREIKDAQARNLIYAVFSSLRRSKKPPIDVLKPATTSQFGAVGSSQSLPFTPISTNSEYSRTEELKRESIHNGRYYRYCMLSHSVLRRERGSLSCSKKTTVPVGASQFCTVETPATTWQYLGAFRKERQGSVIASEFSRRDHAKHFLGNKHENSRGPCRVYHLLRYDEVNG